MQTQTHTGPTPAPNGGGATNKKRSVAVTKIEGSNIHIVFQPSVGGGELRLDTSKIPGADKLSGTALHVFNRGVVSVLQGSYTNLDSDYAKASSNMAKRLLDGTWSPGRTHSAEPKEPDELIVALMEHLKKDTPEQVEKFLVSYAKHHSLYNKEGEPSTAQARRQLRQNSDLAPIIARIVSERARKAAAAAKGGPKENLAAIG